MGWSQLMGSSVVFTGVRQVELLEDEVSAPVDGEVVIRSLFSGVSPGTELRCLRGEQPDSHPFPFLSGYSMCGQVIDAANGGKQLLGKTVFSGGTMESRFARQWGGHASRVKAMAPNVIEIPDGIEPEEAALLQMASIAQRGLERSGVKGGETVVVVGLGLIGQLSATLFAQAGCHVFGVDQDEARCGLAESREIAAAVIPDGEFTRPVLAMYPDGVDVVVDATGYAPVLGRSISLLKNRPWGDYHRKPGVLVVQGSYPGEMSFDYQEAFLKEMTMVMPRHCQPRDTREVIRKLQEGLIDFHGLALKVSPREAPEVYRQMLAGVFPALTAVFDWSLVE